MSNRKKIAIVIPHYQSKKGVLLRALKSALGQTIFSKSKIIVVDDESPYSAINDISLLSDSEKKDIKLIVRKNGGAGAARNTALDNIEDEIEYVAFLDSDDAWRPNHLELAIQALEMGYDAYFSDFHAVGYSDISNMKRIGTLQADESNRISLSHDFYEMKVSALEHTVSDGGGVIGTPTVVYRYHKFKKLRFREEFYNGQDFFFWMDLGVLGARYVFSTQVTCDCGEGFNIYQASGWGTEKSLRRLRNELFIWTSVEEIYNLNGSLRKANKKTILSLQETILRDVLYRLRRSMPISKKILLDIFKMTPSIVCLAPIYIWKVIADKIVSGLK